MKISKKELPLIAVVLLPFLYLAYYWNRLPSRVPIHWNFQGQIDRYGSKMELLLIPILLPLLIYLIFLVIPLIDPKQKLKSMGNKYQRIKSLVTIFMSLLALVIIYSAKNKSLANPNYIILSIGILFLIMGNYFKTIKTNYFLGIRTPWTLEDEYVWKETHKVAGKFWFAGGLIIIVSSLILDKAANFALFLSIAVIITLIPIIYSYVLYQKSHK